MVEFVSRVEIHGKMKGYTDEKLSYCLAEKLQGAAFNVFLRMSDDDQKDLKKLKTELFKEFKKEERNREEAVTELSRRKRQTDETIPTFAYKLTQLVKYACPTFDDEHRNKLSKDYFVNGLSETMQMWLKSSPDFSTKSLKEVTDLAASFEIAGVKSSIKSEVFTVSENNSLVDEIAEQVIKKLKNVIIQNQDDKVQIKNFNGDYSVLHEEECNVNYYDNKRDENQSRRYDTKSNNYQYNKGPGNNYGRNNKTFTNDRKKYKCRTCQSTEHMFRSCPTRFCQACGRRGHDAWDKSCPNFQL